MTIEWNTTLLWSFFVAGMLVWALAVWKIIDLVLVVL